MGPNELFTGQLIDAGGEPLGQPSGVHEDDGGAMLPHQLENSGMNRGPDAPARALGLGANDCGRPAVELGSALEVGHIVHRDLDRDLHRLNATGVDDAHVSIRSPEEFGGLTQGSLRG